MSLIDRTSHTRTSRTRPGPTDTGRLRPDGDPDRLDGSSWPLLVPGARVAVGSWLLLVVPALLAWVAAPLSSVPWLQAVGVGSAGWFLAHGASVAVGSATISVAPLGVTAVLLWLTTRSVRRVLDASEAASRDDAWRRRLAARVVPGYLAGYLGVALVAWSTTLAGAARPSVLGVVGTLWVPVVALAWCLVRRHGRGEAAPVVGPLLDRLPRAVSRALVPGVGGAAVLLGAGILVVAVAVVARLGTVTGLHAALGAGLVGGTVLVVAQLLVVPDLAVWAASWLAGPGFALSDGSSVTLAGAHPGLLPLVPVLGALPSSSSFPPGLLAVLAVPIVIGAVVSWLAARGLARLSSWRTKLVTAASACVVSAVVLLVAAWFASGSLGLSRLAHVGPQPWLVAGATLGELLVGAALHVGVDRVRQRG